jgi:class 3 adenylate cyclase
LTRVVDIYCRCGFATQSDAFRHIGEVVVGKIGDDLRMDYTAQGHTASLGARMEKLASPGSAYVTEYTARLVSGFFRLRDLGRFEVRGVRERWGVFERS